MKKPVAPKKPVKPYQPAEPKEFLPPARETLSLDEGDSLARVLEAIGGIDPKTVFFGHNQGGSDYGYSDSCETYFGWYRKEGQPNPKYEERLAKYNTLLIEYDAKVKKYNADLNKYNAKLKAYNADMIEWRKWYHQNALEKLRG